MRSGRDQLPELSSKTCTSCSCLLPSKPPYKIALQGGQCVRVDVVVFMCETSFTVLHVRAADRTHDRRRECTSHLTYLALTRAMVAYARGEGVAPVDGSRLQLIFARFAHHTSLK